MNEEIIEMGYEPNLPANTVIGYEGAQKILRDGGNLSFVEPLSDGHFKWLGALNHLKPGQKLRANGSKR
jgi:hypothetical protein